jgi:hypothetical protein
VPAPTRLIHVASISTASPIPLIGIMANRVGQEMLAAPRLRLPGVRPLVQRGWRRQWRWRGGACRVRIRLRS